MKVKYKKNHLGKKEGDTETREDNQETKYLIRVGVLEVKESKPAKNRKTKELKTDKETK